MLNTVLLVSKVKKLYTENQRQKRKRATRRMSAAEGASRAQAAETRHEEATAEAAE